jgi:hypothetical protein
MFAVKIDDAAFQRTLGSVLNRQFRFAQAATLTKVAKYGQMDLRSATSKAFSNPTPYTLNATFVRPATPSRLEATVGFRDLARSQHYLEPEVHGGTRHQKRFEFHLRNAGVLASGESVVPATGYPLDAYGNVPRKVYAAILADVQAHPDKYSWSTKESRAKRSRRKDVAKRAIYFAPPRGGRLPPGIYERVRTAWGSATRGVFMFVTTPRYRIRLPMRDIIQRTIDVHMEREFDLQFKNAQATAR